MRVNFCQNGSDHPRSRGVYLGDNNSRVGGVGSSPLARGLLDDRLDVVEASRIIPARAGFTMVLTTITTQTRDHPRSRGVYDLIMPRYNRMYGSSPLARGLHWLNRHPRADVRIIPARAGFTPSTRNSWSGNSDHPRSRGVYRSQKSPIRRIEGSSPLARGLLPDNRDAVHLGGIIPARAGFTR